MHRLVWQWFRNSHVHRRRRRQLLLRQRLASDHVFPGWMMYAICFYHKRGPLANCFTSEMKPKFTFGARKNLRSIELLFVDAQFRRNCVELIKWKSALQSGIAGKQKQIQFPVTIDLVGWRCTMEVEQRKWRRRKLKSNSSSSRYVAAAVCAIIINWKLSRLAFGEMRNSMRLRKLLAAHSI